MLRRLFDYLYNKLRSRQGLALLALALLVNIGALIAVDAEVVELDRARESTVHSRIVISEILRVQSMLYESESAQRGFLYTEDEKYLAPLTENANLIPGSTAKLQKLVADNAAQQRRVDVIRALVLEKLTEVNQTVAHLRAGQKTAARTLVMGDVGKKLMDQIDAEVVGFIGEEEALLVARRQKWDEIQVRIRWGFAIVLFINALMILAGAVAIMRGLAREEDRDQKDLVQHEEREAQEGVQQDKRDAAELVRHDEREAQEGVQQDKRDAAELVRHDEREAVAATEVFQHAAELRALTAHLLRRQEEERRTIARDLHDELGGTLSAIKLDIIMGRDAAAKHSDTKSVARSQRALTAVDGAVQFVRRLIEDLRPTLLDNLGLEVALRALATQFGERAGCECVISLPEGELNLTSTQSTTLYRVCQEALTNVMKYAKAKRVTISLTSDDSRWVLLIADDGVGLDDTKQHRTSAYGLLGMRERIVALGGSFDIRGPAGRGTTLTATFPVTPRRASPLPSSARAPQRARRPASRPFQSYKKSDASPITAPDRAPYDGGMNSTIDEAGI